MKDCIIRCLEYIGEDPTREGLIETPSRVIRSWEELFSGYKQNPDDVFKKFDGDGVGGLVYLKDIEFYSTCEHHMLPFWGTAMIAYIPNGKVIGVSKLARLLDIFARRLQIQERIGEQVTDALMRHLNPIGAACLLEAKHFCISSRGVRKQHSVMGYSSMKGVFLEKTDAGIAARAELMSLWGK
jgi:GTP cyclohydrolase I